MFLRALDILSEWLKTPEEREEWVSKDEPYWKMPLHILAGVASVAIVVILIFSGVELMRSLGDAVATSAGVVTVGMSMLARELDNNNAVVISQVSDSWNTCQTSGATGSSVVRNMMLLLP